MSKKSKEETAIRSLPKPVLGFTFTFLTFPELNAVRLVNKEWRSVCCPYETIEIKSEQQFYVFLAVASCSLQKIEFKYNLPSLKELFTLPSRFPNLHSVGINFLHNGENLAFIPTLRKLWKSLSVKNVKLCESNWHGPETDALLSLFPHVSVLELQRNVPARCVRMLSSLTHLSDLMLGAIQLPSDLCQLCVLPSLVTLRIYEGCGKETDFLSKGFFALRKLSLEDFKVGTDLERLNLVELSLICCHFLNNPLNLLIPTLNVLKLTNCPPNSISKIFSSCEPGPSLIKKLVFASDWRQPAAFSFSNLHKFQALESFMVKGNFIFDPSPICHPNLISLSVQGFPGYDTLFSGRIDCPNIRIMDLSRLSLYEDHLSADQKVATSGELLRLVQEKNVILLVSGEDAILKYE